MDTVHGARLISIGYPPYIFRAWPLIFCVGIHQIKSKSIREMFFSAAVGNGKRFFIIKFFYAKMKV